MEKVMKTLEGHEVYLISTVMPDSWQKSVNEEIMNASLQHSNVKVIIKIANNLVHLFNKITELLLYTIAPIITKRRLAIPIRWKK